MKLILFIAVLFCSYLCVGQPPKSDSLAKVESQKIVDDITEKTSIKEFEQWLYKNWTAEKYNEFATLYNFFIREKYKEYKKPKL